MKPLVLEYSVSREQWVAGLMAVLARYSADDPYRTRMIVARLIGLVVLILAWGMIGWSPWSLFAACLLLPLGELFTQRTIGRKAIGSTFDPGESEIWLEVSEDGLHEKTRNRERRYLWSGVGGVFETGGVIVFDLAGTDILVVPASAISDDQRQQLDDGLAENRLAVTRRSRLDARSGTVLPEVATIGKISVAVAIMSAMIGWATSGPVLMAGGPDNAARNMLLALGAGLVLAVLGWLVAGALLRAAARRSEASANALAWAMFAAATVAFIYGFLWR